MKFVLAYRLRLVLAHRWPLGHVTMRWSHWSCKIPRRPYMRKYPSEKPFAETADRPILLFNGIKPADNVASKQPGEWNTFLIRVEGQIYNVTLNGEPVIA